MEKIPINKSWRAGEENFMFAFNPQSSSRVSHYLLDGEVSNELKRRHPRSVIASPAKSRAKQSRKNYNWIATPLLYGGARDDDYSLTSISYCLSLLGVPAGDVALQRFKQRLNCDVAYAPRNDVQQNILFLKSYAE